MNPYTSRTLGVILALLISGVPEPALLLAQQSPAPAQAAPQTQNPQPASATPSSSQPPDQIAPPQQSQDQTTDEQRQQQEDKASQQMINGTPEQGTQLPESPDSVRARQQAQQAQQPIGAQPAQPSGTAAAQQGLLAGGLASRPAGAAIAPAKQGQVRSFLIKLGVIAGAGVALGTVYALSRASSPTPPGAR